jgi:hypothetical protein
MLGTAGSRAPLERGKIEIGKANRLLQLADTVAHHDIHDMWVSRTVKSTPAA